MSQVIVTDDQLKARRVKSGQQERAIDVDSQFKKWKLSDITGFDPIAAGIGLAVLPIVASWYLIAGVVKLAIMLVSAISTFVGALIGSTK